MTILLASFYFLLVDHTPLAAGARGAAELPAEVAARVCADETVPRQVEVAVARDAEGSEVLRGRAAFRRQEAGAVERSVDFDYYRAAGAGGAVVRRPAIVISPITGGNYEESRLIARDLVRHGYHAVIVKRPADERALRRQADLARFETAMRDAIAARRRVIDWLVAREEIDAERIGAYGVSLGAVLTAVLAATDERVKASVVVMGCGDLPALLCRSVEGEAVRLARAHGLPADPGPADRQAFEELARPFLLTDPERLAPYVDPREIYLVLTRRDTSVPSFLQVRLREALGGAESISLPTGHYAAVAYLPVILERSRGFLARRFEGEGN